MFATSMLGLVLLALPAAPIVAEGSPRQVLPGDLTTLQAAGLPADGSALLKFLQRRADPDRSMPLVEDAITRLSDANKDKFDVARVDLLGYGAVAIPALQRLANRVEQPEAAARARACIGFIEGHGGSNVTLAVIRAVGSLKPEQTEAVLFGYLPFAENEAVFRETQQTLTNLCPLQGPIPEPFALALRDEDSIRRQAAAEILCTVHGVAAHPQVRPLLKDSRPGVRLRVALALTESFDPAAVPVLIDLLATASAADRRRIEESLMRIAGEWAFTSPLTDDRVAGELRRSLWKTWWDTLSEDRLLGLFRSLVQSEDDYLRWQELLSRLNAAEPETREKALSEIVATGPGILPLVRRLAQAGSPRERLLATQAITLLERGGPPLRLPECAPRLLALRRPASTVQVLLDSIPWLDHPAVEQQVREVLPVLATEDGKPAAILVERLRSKLPVIRGAAATTLARVGGPTELTRVRDLLTDPDATVRLHASTGLVGRGDREAVPVLIDLLASLPIERVAEAEDFLAELAGAKAPAVVTGSTPEERTRCRDAWAAWWQTAREQIQLEVVRAVKVRTRTLFLIESYDPTRRNGRIMELDRSGRVLLDLSGLSYPMYAERVGTDRLLIAEQGTSRISERDLQGRVLKEWSVPSAFLAHRLRNGNTFLGGRNQLQEVDRENKPVWTYTSPADTILTATRHRDGQVTVLTYQGNLIRLDTAGKPVKTTTVPLQALGGVNCAEILPGDRVLCATTAQNRVVEFDENGKIAWETNVPAPQSVTRLPGGTTLVATTAGTKLIEMDRTGRAIQEWKDLPVRPIRAMMR